MSTAKERERQKEKDIKFREVDVYHKIQNFAKNYVTFSESIPTPLSKVNQNLHEEVCKLSISVFRAANEPLSDISSKVKLLAESESHIKTIYSRIQYLITVKSISARKWDYLSRTLMEIYGDIQKWKQALSVKSI